MKINNVLSWMKRGGNLVENNYEILLEEKNKKVIGIEIVEDAIIDAKENAEMNEKKNIER